MKKAVSEKTAQAAFALCVFAASAFFVVQSVRLYRAFPGADGPAVIPLISAALAAAASLFIALSALCPRGGSDGGRQAGIALLPAAITVGMCAVYCVLMVLGLSFWIVTPLFLWGFMTLLQRGGYLKNILWTALFTAFIFAVFRVLFSLNFG